MKPLGSTHIQKIFFLTVAFYFWGQSILVLGMEALLLRTAAQMGKKLPISTDLLGSNGNKYWFCLIPKANSELQPGVMVNKMGFHHSCRTLQFSHQCIHQFPLHLFLFL